MLSVPPQRTVYLESRYWHSDAVDLLVVVLPSTVAQVQSCRGFCGYRYARSKNDVIARVPVPVSTLIVCSATPRDPVVGL